MKVIAERLKQCIRKEDIVSRLGGDEFTILLSTIGDQDDALKVVEKVLEAFKQYFIIEDHELFISPSIGISIYPTHGETADTLIKRADNAKEHGKNRYKMYSEDIEGQALDKWFLENDLRKALTKLELELYYQPKFDIRTNKMIGIEALVRWHHPNLGILSPENFIPLAEEIGMIIPLGELVLRMACKKHREWQDVGYPLHRIAVNLSVKQFKEENLIEIINGVLKETEIETKYLELEITESALIDDVFDANLKLNQLRTMGIKVSIDDFGTGYSSLSYLKKFPIDSIKIDKSFIHDVSVDSDSAAIVQAIISMGQKLRLQIVAEGVETVEQLEFLQKNDCFEAQGYLFSQPLPAEEFEKMFLIRCS